MSTINPNNPPASNPQLAGILGSVPMPAAVLNPNASVNVGADDGGFAAALGLGVSGGGGQVVVGGAGTAPANGAQPAAPPGFNGAAAPTNVPVGANGVATTVTTATTTTTVQPTGETGSPLAEATSGFGKANRNQPIRASIDGATFGFPSFKATSKTNTAPPINWGPGWKRVEKDGLWYMEHTNGSKAIPAIEYRITPRPADKVQTIKVANGWGKKFPDGSILVFDRKEGPYRLDPKGNKHKVELGNIEIGGVKVRVFEASVVRTLDKDGKVDVFDSRGNRSTGTTRWNMAAGIGAADAGATMGGGKPVTEGGGGKPVTEGGGAPGKVDGGGGVLTTAQLTQDVQKLTELARAIIGEIQSGNVDPARLAALQAQLSQLPSGILQAAGAAGTMTSNGTTTGQPGSLVGGTNGVGVPPTAGTSGGGTTAPTPGVDANATTKELAAGTTAKVDAAAIPAELHGKQARFGQLPENVQAAVAAAYGSDQGAGAFTPDRLIAFSSDGTVKVVDAGVVYLRHQSQVRGAGPGEDRAMTMRPNRQPRSTGNVTSGGGGAATTTTPSIAGNGGAHVGHSNGVNASSTSGGGNSATKIELFKSGGETRHVDLGGLNGSFTWKTLPAQARAAIMEMLRTAGDDASKAFASRTGTGWAIDPNAVIVIDAGFASFPNGLSMSRGSAATPTPAVTGGGAAPSNRPVGHDATRPPVGGGGAVRPSMAPPVPTVADPGDGHAHSHA